MKKKCSVKDCNKEVHAKGYCIKHYTRYLKYGSVHTTLRMQHGMSHYKEYKTWDCMKERCYNKKHDSYKYYGGRGIKVCDRWKNNFLAFYKDMGKRPFLTAQIDRINNDGDYEPSNCRWLSGEENTRKRSNAKLTIEEVTAIRESHSQGTSRKEIALAYSISLPMVHCIIHNMRWRV